MALVSGGIVDDYPIDGDGKRRGAFSKWLSIAKGIDNQLNLNGKRKKCNGRFLLNLECHVFYWIRMNSKIFFFKGRMRHGFPLLIVPLKKYEKW